MKKRIGALLLALVMVLSVLPVGAFAAERSYDGTELLYVNLGAVNWWRNDNAVTRYYFFGDSGSAWSEPVVAETVNVYKAAVPAGTWKNVIVVRYDPAYTGGNYFDAGWHNQTGDIELDASKNYIKSFAQDSAEATWSTYTEMPAELTVYYVDEADQEEVWICAFSSIPGAPDELPVIPVSGVEGINNPPGIRLNPIGKDKNGKNVYRYVLETARYDALYFNNGSAWRTSTLSYIDDSAELGLDHIVYFGNATETDADGNHKAYPTTDVWKVKETVAPTCTEDGYRVLESFISGATENEPGEAALGHAWNDGEITTAPTLTAEGVKTYTCTRPGCGATRTDPVEKLPAVDTAALEAAIAAAKAVVRNDYTAETLADMDAALAAAEAALASDTLSQEAADAAATALVNATNALLPKDAVPMTVYYVDENDFETVNYYAAPVALPL